MFLSTLEKLACPRCRGRLQAASGAERNDEMHSGEVACAKCRTRYPVLAGIALLVPEPDEYLVAHVKGVSKLVTEKELPKRLRDEFREAKASIEAEHIEEDLEAERVIALYFLNHFVRAEGHWWKPEGSPADPVMDELIRKHWDRGPLTWVTERFRKSAKPESSVLDLGCGVGGLAPRLQASDYLGIDSSFLSIALARHVVLGAHYPEKLRAPAELLQGPLAREVKVAFDLQKTAGRADFVVGEFAQPPFRESAFDVAIAMNTLDMLEEPAELPRQMRRALRPGGLAYQSGPYIWHALVAEALRQRLPRTIRDSARAAEWLFEQAGFNITHREDHVPWLFFKHLRQLELYSVHLFEAARKN